MMHRIKHDIKRHTSSSTRTPDSALYADYVEKLANLYSCLKDSAKAITNSEIAWREMRVKQRTFAEQFLSRYPDKDILREHAKMSAESSQRLTNELGLGYEGSSEQQTELTALVSEYIGEIAAVQNQYKIVHELTTDLKMYTKKCEDLTKGKQVDQSKLSRNLEKREEARQKYDAKLEEVLGQMQRVYDRRGVALRAAYVAFWGMQMQAGDSLNETLGETRRFVLSSARQLQGANLAGMTDDFAARFNSSVTVSPEMSGLPAQLSGSLASTTPSRLPSRVVPSSYPDAAGDMTQNIPQSAQSSLPQGGQGRMPYSPQPTTTAGTNPSFMPPAPGGTSTSRPEATGALPSNTAPGAQPNKQNGREATGVMPQDVRQSAQPSAQHSSQGHVPYPSQFSDQQTRPSMPPNTL